jgi:ribosomal protein L11 methyltransferase
MKRKNIWRVSIGTTPEAEDAVTEMLGSFLGTTASAYFDVEASTTLVSAFLQTTPAKKIRQQIGIYLEQIRRCGLDVGRADIHVTRVPREDWAESWKRHFKPMEIGQALLIRPSWSKKRARPKQAVVILDPGLSFGTGQHATTSFCLQELVRCRFFSTVQSFLDIGTGSGILAISAAKLGFRPVDAFDFDPESVRVARANARVNRVLPRLKISRDDITRLPRRSSKKYDLICANLISNLLIAEKKPIISRLKRDGTLVLAGILAAEFDQVEAAFSSAGLELVSSQTEKEWRSGSFRFKQTE